MPCSKVLVMDEGRIVQQGSPLALIWDEGKFREMCMAQGQEEFGQLLAIAEEEMREGDADLVVL